MRIYKTVVVEDEGPARRRLEAMVKANKMLMLSASLTNGRKAIENLERLDPDILLMDIQLKDKDAFEVLEALGGKLNCKIIFVTAYDTYALKAFEFNAIDYLLKPFDEDRFNKSIERIVKIEKVPVIDSEMIDILRKGLDTDKEQVCIPEGNKKHIYLKKDIIFIQSDRYYAYITSTSDKRLVRITLKKLEETLPSSFLRINKSVIVNSEFVTQIEYLKQGAKIKLKTGDSFHASRTYNAEVKSFFGKVFDS